MKKKWLILSLFILMAQLLMPLVTLAEVIREDTRSSGVKLLSLSVVEKQISNPEEIDVSLRLTSDTSEETENVINLDGFVLKSSNNESIKNDNGDVVGYYEQLGTSLKVYLEKEISSEIEFVLKGTLLDQETTNQIISASYESQVVSETIELISDEETTETTSDEQEEATVETDETTTTKENESTEESVVEEVSNLKQTRKNQDISELLGNRAFFKDVVMKKKDLNNAGFITIDGEKTPITLGEALEINMNYELPEDVREKMKSGDFYEFVLPSEIGIYTPIEGELVSEETGAVYATYKIDTSGKGRITFNDLLESEYGIQGEFQVKSELKQGNMKEYGENVIVFPFVDESPEVKVFLQNQVKNAMSKKGNLNRKNNPTHINWDVDINLNYGIHHNAVVTEVFPEGTFFESIEIKELLVGLDGRVQEGEVLSSSDYSVSSDGSKIIFKNKINKAYRLSYTTKIDDRSKPGESGGSVNYNNQVKMTSDDVSEELITSATVNAQYKKMLTKQMTKYNPDSQVMSWKIEYNHIESTIKKDKAFLRDIFDGNMVLNRDSLDIRKLTFNDNGTQVGQGEKLIEGQHYQLVPNGNGFNIQFLEDINYATTISYQTFINEEIHGSDDKHVYTNYVEDGNKNEASSKGEAYQRVLAKWHSDINYRNKTVDWHIRVNTNKYEMNNFVLEDTMSTGLTILGEPAKIDIRDFTAGKTLVQGKDYLFDYSTGSKTFKISFIGDYAKTNNVFEISYETLFDTPKLHEAGEERFSNNAKSTWTTHDGRVVTNSSGSSFEPRPEDQSDGFKHGNYNAKTKEIEWQLGINYNRQKLGDVVIRDALNSNQVYVPGSLKLYRYTISDSGEVIPGKRIVGKELEDILTVIEPTKNDGLFSPKDILTANELRIKLKEVNKDDQYLMTFNTSLVGQVIHESNKYHNTALVQASEVGPDSFKIEGDVSVANGDTFIEKSGFQDTDGFLQWKVTINPSQSTIYNPVITDKPSSNQSIIKESITLYELNTDERGNLKKGQAIDAADYSVVIDTNDVTYEQALKITFKEDKIDRAYLLEYKSTLFLEKNTGEFVTNKVEIKGNNQEVLSQEKSKKVSVKMSSGSGTASGKQGKLYILKSSEEYGEDISKPLVGTVFEIFDKTGKRSFGTAETGSDGQAIFSKLPLGEYLLKEIKPSEGYQISDELAKGVPVSVTRLTSTGVEKLAFTNEKLIEKTKITAKKNWDDQNNQDGIRPNEVEVQLYRNDQKEGNPVRLHAGNNWFYEWTNLNKTEKGKEVTYSVKEITKVPHYELVSETNDSQGNFEFTNQYTPEVITLSGTKTWNDKNNQDGVRPDDIIVNVLQNGQEFVAKKVKPDSAGEWKYTFKDLPKYDKGKEIKYAITENEIEGYTPKVTGYDIENIHTPGKTSLFVSKAWNDENNQDGKRAKSVSVQLYANEKKIGTAVELNEANDWQHQWVDLDEKQSGELIKYEVKEITQIPGYTTEVNTEHAGNVIITNTHVPETTSVSGTKMWNDQNNQDGLRPEAIIVNVLQDGQEFLSKKVKADNNNEWHYEFKDLQKYKNGNEIKYTVTENSIDGYTPLVTGYDIENTHTPEKTGHFVSKQWADENNQDGKRPKSIWVQLYANGKKQGDEVELSEANKWQYQWTDLDLNELGEKVVYQVKEVTQVSGYETEINEDIPGNSLITNTHVPETISITGEKTWNDKNNQDGLRPETIVVNVLQNGQEFVSKKVKSNKDGKWLYEFNHLPKYHQGKEIKYTVTENEVAEYTPQVSGYDIENSHTPGKTSLFVSKNWDDANNQDGKRPKSVFVQLYGDDQKQGKEIELNEGNNWQYQWTDLDEKSAGKVIHYEVEEVTEVPGYKATVNTKNPGNVIITNTHIPETVSVSGEKTWNDQNNQDGLRPEWIVVNVLQDNQEFVSQKVKPTSDGLWLYEFKDLPKYQNGKEIKYSVSENNIEDYTPKVTGYDIENTHTPGKTSLFVSKSWDDENNQDGKRAAMIDVQLYANGAKQGEPVSLNEGNNWQYRWTDLDEKSAGKVIHYEVEEITEVPDYTTIVNTDNPGNVIITNVHTPETVSVSGEKTWNDKENQDGLRPEWIVVNVLQDGQEFVSKKIKPIAGDIWKYEFDGLPKYKNGEVIHYTVSENKIAGYTPKITGYDIENIHTPGKTSFFVSKAWNDENNQDGKRASSVEVQLYADGQKHGELITLSEGNNWQYQWTDLDEKSKGKEIIYSVKEISKVPEYTSTINNNLPGNSIITNTHTPEVVTISGEKTWDDHNNQDGVRPESIVVNLLQEKQEYMAMKVKPDANNNWLYEFNDLPKYSKGQELTYSIRENQVEGYTPTYTENNIKNTHTPGKTDIHVSKTWEDNNNQDGKRDNIVWAQLYGNNQEIGAPLELHEGNNWQNSWTDLDINQNGQKIIYRIKELSINPEYVSTVDDRDLGNVIITNSYEPKTINLLGVKQWEDNDDQDGVRPDSITVNLQKNNQPFLSTEVKADTKGEWHYAFNNLPEYSDGYKNTYSVTEDKVDDYVTDVKGTTITNTHQPGKTNVAVSKVWDDNNNQDGKRPDYIKVQLYANGKKHGGSIELNEDNQWRYNWINLDEKSSGKVITYTVVEESVVDEYVTTVNDSDKQNIIITNRHEPEVINVSGIKQWEDNNNQDGIRPESITVNLLQNNQKIDSKVIASVNKDEWHYNFENLPKYQEGQEVVYSITEDHVDGYTATYKDTDIVNSHTPDKMGIHVSKAWNDNDNQDGKRPEFVTVQLYANNEVAGEEVVLNEANAWKHQWTDLDSNQNGQKIHYEVKETTEVPGYTVDVDDKDLGNIIITNSYVPEKMTISGMKKWSDDSDKAGQRPTGITLNLLKNGQTYKSQEVTGDQTDEWQYEFENVPKYEEGQEILYTITENSVADYTTTVSGYDVLNTYTPGDTSVTVNKYWKDNQNKAGKRPKSIDVQLYQNGQKFGEVVQLSDKNNWGNTWQELPLTENGKEMTYTVKEVTQLADYRETVNNQDIGNMIITNTYTGRDSGNGKGGGSVTPKNPSTKLPQSGEKESAWLVSFGLVLTTATSCLYINRRRKSINH